MSLTTTTLSSAVTATDRQIVVASATGFAAGNRILVDQEVMRVSKAYSSGTTILLDGRGLDGTVVGAHVTTANVTTGTSQDFASAGPQTPVTYAIAGRVRTLTSYSASGAITLPTAGTDAVAIIDGTTGVDMTVAAPTKDMDGSILWVSTNGAATTSTVTFTGGLNGAGTSYDKITFNTSAPVCVQAMAVNGNWMSIIAPAMGGTVTNLIGTIG